MTARLVVLVSGGGSNLQALLDACADPAYGARVVAVGSDRDGIRGLERAEAADVPTFVISIKDCRDRADFDDRVLAAIESYEPDLVVLAGYMKILGAHVVGRFPTVNTHPALLPSFPGAYAVRDALSYGVKVTGVTVHFADADVDSGAILAQEAVTVREDDDEESLHERIKVVERRLLADTVGRVVRGGYRIEGRKVVLP
ncbi:MAG TPA: phosphoribosylglycinamide formyltransferase [Frankiaceae bacterium]|nr:phosphoribosylglycinamide formyltransferase [Frankiaceae bacterium]